MKTVHFVSGLPRSGSTLLCNLLAQNPRFHATHTSGCIEILLLLRNNWDKIVEHRANLDWAALQRVLTETLYSYHSTDKPVIFDKSRAWLAYIEFIENILQKKARILVTVRPIVEVLASFEKRARESSKFHQIPGEGENYFKFQSVEGRCDHLLQPENVVGLAFTRIKEALLRGLGDRLLFVDFNSFTRSPKKQIRTIYDFLGEKDFTHDFDHVKQVTQENDMVHGYYQLHRIREKVEPVAADALQILGERLVKKYSTYQINVG